MVPGVTIIGLLGAAGVVAGNYALAVAGQPGVGAAIDTVILAVLVLLLDHLRERERRDRAADRRDQQPK